MMRAEGILADLREAGVKVTVVGTDLRLAAPRGVLDPALPATIAAHKADILALLARERGAASSPEPPDSDPPRNPAGLKLIGICHQTTTMTDGVCGGDAAAETTVRNALALPVDERAAWRQEIVDALVWVGAGRGQDPLLEHDLRALRRLVPLGTCLRCDAPCPADGRHWCPACSVEDREMVEVRS